MHNTNTQAIFSKQKISSNNKYKMMKGSIVAVLVILALAVAVQRSQAVECGEIDAALVPCMSYLMGREADPPAPCCTGVRKVKELSGSTADKRVACGCVKEAASHYSQLSDTAAENLATKCDVKLDIPVSRTVDCSKIA